MNITPYTASLPLATVVNPPTEGLRRDNHQREIITQVIATNPSVAEKGVASDKERARTPAQANEQVDFASLRKQAEHAASSISEQGDQQGKSQQDEHTSQQNQEGSQAKTSGSTAENDKSDKNSNKELADEKVINQLQQRDQEVRTHELAHASAGGAATGSPSYTFEIGPDGKKYAVGGEVAVDLSIIAGDPQATIVKMQKVHAAALAPASPSAQDTRVAASAAQKILTAQSELLALKSDGVSQSSPANNNLNIKAYSNFNNDNHDSSNAFDTFVKQTLSAQEAVIASSSTQKLASSQEGITVQSTEVLQRAHRIETFYFNVSQAYEKPDNFQFELIA